MKAIICPSLLASDLSRLAEESERIISLGADYLHLDVMDAHFVPNLTFGPPVLRCLRRNLPDAFFDVHIMIENPLAWVDSYVDSGANSVTFHFEAVDCDPDIALRVCRRLRHLNCKASVSLKPGTPVTPEFRTLLDTNEVDMVLIMSVEPGFGGQSFMTETMDKVRLLRENYPNLDLQVDGGVGPSTIEIVAEAGANVIVSGSGVFKADDPGEVMRSLREVVEGEIQKRG